MAIRSSTELESHFARARNAKLITAGDCDASTADSTSIRKMLHALRDSLDN